MGRSLLPLAVLLVTLAPPDVGVAPPSPPAVTHWPAAVAPVAGAVHRPFEQPDGPYGPGHRGIDLAARPGEPVRAAMAGVVRFAGPVAGETWITIRHTDGLETTYGGVAATVRAGDRIALGQSLGRVRSGRRHLDWSARLHGAYIDPLGLLAGWRVRLVAVDEGG